MSTRYTARQIRRFLEADSEKTQKGSPRYDTEYIQRERGGSRPPLTEEGLRWIDEGLDFTDSDGSPLMQDERVRCAARLRRVLYDLRNERTPFGHTLGDILALMRTEPSFARWIEEGASRNAESYRNAFETVCMVAATEFGAAFPRVELRVRVSEGDERARRKTPEAYNRERRITAQDSYRSLYGQLLKIEEEGSLSRTAAKEELAKEKNCSVWRIQDAITFCTREQASKEGGVA